MELPLVHDEGLVCELPEGHRFPMEKFNLLARVLREEGVARGFHRPEAISREGLELAHTRAYLDSLFEGTIDPQHVRRIGLPITPALLRRTQLEVGATVLASRLALEHGLACSLAGGTHHAFADAGSGFCLLNDLAVAAHWVRAEHDVERVLILDLDVHQGDGTAAIFQGEPRVFTLSVHCEANFPLRKQRSTLDLPVAVGMGDAEYVALLERTLPGVLREFEPEFVLYDAGVDVHERDRLGKLALTDEGVMARDLYVLRTLAAHEIPTACVIGGGYPRVEDSVEVLARRHATVHRAAHQVWRETH